jgi:hypothetical protein
MRDHRLRGFDEQLLAHKCLGEQSNFSALHIYLDYSDDLTQQDDVL